MTVELGQNSDLVAVWEVPLQSGHYSIEFEHGTTTGKRIIRVNGKEILRRDWMFKLVGNEDFTVDESKFKIRVEPFGLFAYRYTLDVNGKPFREFIEAQSKILKTWIVNTGPSEAEQARVVLEKSTLDIWVNGSRMDTTIEFIDGGTQTHFQIGGFPAILHTFKTGLKKQPIIYSLMFNGTEICEAQE